MLFVDSSALVAILAPEADGEEIAARLNAHPDSLTSSLVVFETVLALGRLRKAPAADMTGLVAEFLQRARIHSIAIEGDQYVSALNTHAQYGKGTGHPARLNLGDCFSYSMAKRAGVELLYKGDDFAQTDLA